MSTATSGGPEKTGGLHGRSALHQLCPCKSCIPARSSLQRPCICSHRTAPRRALQARSPPPGLHCAGLAISTMAAVSSDPRILQPQAPTPIWSVTRAGSSRRCHIWRSVRHGTQEPNLPEGRRVTSEATGVSRSGAMAPPSCLCLERVAWPPEFSRAL